MRIIIDGRTYEAATAVALIDEIKDMNWAVKTETDAEGYIAIQMDTYRMMTGREMRLPKGDTEARAVAMFESIAALGTWEIIREG